MDTPLPDGGGILHHGEGVDLLPANIELSGLEVTLVNIMSRETILRQYLQTVSEAYDAIILDCMPSLGMLTINALAAADEVLIPAQAHFLSIKGLEQLLRTIKKVKRQINPALSIAGILVTMADMRTNYAREIVEILRDTYGEKIRIFSMIIAPNIVASVTLIWSGCWYPRLAVREPCGSASTKRTFFPSRASPIPIFTELVVFAHPPFWLHRQ